MLRQFTAIRSPLHSMAIATTPLIEELDKVLCAANAPQAVEVEANKIYSWCTCGRTATSPFCDGRHKGTHFKSLKVSFEEAGVKKFCCCKKTKNPLGLCDGSHKQYLDKVGTYLECCEGEAARLSYREVIPPVNPK